MDGIGTDNGAHTGNVTHEPLGAGAGKLRDPVVLPTRSRRTADHLSEHVEILGRWDRTDMDAISAMEAKTRR